MPAVEYEPEDPKCWDLLSESLAACGQIEEAEAVLWHTRARFGDDAHVKTQLAKYLAHAGRLPEAEALYRETLRLAPGDTVAAGALAHLLTENQQEAEAETRFRDAIAADPDCTNAIFRTELARLLVRQGRWPEAESLSRQTMAEFPNNAHCRLDYGLELVRRGEMEVAEGILAELKALRVSEADALAHHIRLKAEDKLRPVTRSRPLPQRLELPGDYVPMDESWQALRAGFLLGLPKDLLLCTPEERNGLRKEAEETLARLLTTHRSHPLVRMVAARRRFGEIIQPPVGTRLSFPLALELARGKKEQLNDVMEHPDVQRPLVWLALLQLGADEDASALYGLIQWLAGTVPQQNLPIAYLHQRLRGLSKINTAIKHAKLPQASFKTISFQLTAQMEELAPDLLDIALMRMAEEELTSSMTGSLCSV